MPAHAPDDGYEVDDDPARVDLDVVWDFLSQEAYWGRDRTRAEVEEQVRVAWRVVAAYAPDGRQVAFARAVSDGVRFAYLADVFVVDAHRGRGLGTRVVRAMVDDGPGADLRWVLFTQDAHGLYERFGFAAPDATALVRPAGLAGTPAAP
ncbi:GNAT family N-acetyltransferase [Cellulomonas shaoxiangyii]|uniref:N-acetyltransferase n=1 Tax=Cellulomonas shaoxiangyii TaxID=2566013 RepID=A0A4P7SH77_9CELL|nr:GNAT family N-acetyltransferase [Cellulomonas shaoxiangyii]QCB92446.1 N-acetyltransferase [Cellulomonas shaoxiangyii]TGY85649.1 N-acetyltransferase [Cellulomonas shaoxiangyii]